VNSLGKQVVAIGDGLAVGADGAGEVSVVTASAGIATLNVLDANGDVVGTRELGPVPAGRQTIAVGDAAKGLKPGAYRYEVVVSR
jgi:hypothetical protein